MSIQTNQYIMYAISVPPKQFKGRGGDWYDQMSEKFGDDTAYDTRVNHADGIFWLYDGMSGSYSLIGRVMNKSAEGECLASNGPMTMPILTDEEKQNILQSIQKNFDLSGDLHLYLVTHYR